MVRRKKAPQKINKLSGIVGKKNAKIVIRHSQRTGKSTSSIIMKAMLDRDKLRRKDKEKQDYLRDLKFYKDRAIVAFAWSGAMLVLISLMIFLNFYMESTRGREISKWIMLSAIFGVGVSVFHFKNGLNFLKDRKKIKKQRVIDAL